MGSTSLHKDKDRCQPDPEPAYFETKMKLRMHYIGDSRIRQQGRYFVEERERRLGDVEGVVDMMQ